MTQLYKKILIANNLIEINQESNSSVNESNSDSMVGTLVSNMAYYGYAPSMTVLKVLRNLDSKNLKEFWAQIEPVFKELTGDNKKMDSFVVYKNFPKEVLEKSQAEYWIAQIYMYWGAKNEYFTQEVADRPQMMELKLLKVLQLSDKNSLQNIYEGFIKNPARWTEPQKEHAQFLMKELKVQLIDIDAGAFKENSVLLAKLALDNSLAVKVSTATDVLRLASAMSEGDISLKTNVKFKKFKRSERKMLLGFLDASNNLMADVTTRPEMFKRLLQSLHPGDYKFSNVTAVYDNLYKKDYTTLNAQMDNHVTAKNEEVFVTLASRPGEFVRKLHHLYTVFGVKAVDAFVPVVQELKTIQLLKLSKYIETINERKTLIFPPKGNWTKAQISENTKAPFDIESKNKLLFAIGQELSNRLGQEFPNGVKLGYGLDKVKLQTNDQELASYGRGTVFEIPENVDFIRTASYWEQKSSGNTWFDNGWNFFDKDWTSLDTCCWNQNNALNKGAIFSGDPTNSKDLKGRACQMIDLYIDKLTQNGARYAVWNILAFSRIPFGSADVMGTLQWGEGAQTGKLYEPNRAQMVFPLKGDNFTKYVAYVDLLKRKLVYMDANLYGNVQSAQSNAADLSKKMPAFVEYLNALPSVEDLFVHAPQSEAVDATPVLYSDAKVKVSTKEAYVFKPENIKNKFSQIDLSEILSKEIKKIVSKTIPAKKAKLK